MAVSVAVRNPNGSMAFSVQVSISDAMVAQFFAPASRPAKNAFFRYNAIGLMVCSTALLSISVRPSERRLRRNVVCSLHVAPSDDDVSDILAKLQLEQRPMPSIWISGLLLRLRPAEYISFSVSRGPARGVHSNPTQFRVETNSRRPALIQTRNLIDRFQTMIRRKAKTGIDPWIVDARDSLFAPFANGILKTRQGCRRNRRTLVERLGRRTDQQSEASGTVDRRNVKEAVNKYASAPIFHAETPKGKFDAPAGITRLTDVRRNR